MASKRTPFDLQSEIQKAWDWCWKYYCEPSTYEEDEYTDDGMPTGKKTGVVRTIEPRQSWLTATDLERRVRAAAAEVMEGAEYGSQGADAWGSTVRVRITGGSLLDAVRGWLLRNPNLEQHNFGRGHISGMRFRPRGMGLTESEQKTVEQRRKRNNGETPIHFYDGALSFRSGPLCTKATRTDPTKKRAMYRQPSRSKARTTRESDKVTCPRCLKLLRPPGLKYAKRDRLLNLPGTPLHGALVKVIRISPITGDYTVELKETRGAYLKGVDRLTVKPYELQ